MIKKILYALFLFFTNSAIGASTSSIASKAPISYPLHMFDHADILDIAKLCEVAYEDTVRLYELESSGWEINRLYTSSQYAYGIKATNGPLSVLSFKGTDDKTTFMGDMKAVRQSSEHIFPHFEADVLHKGIYDYYASLKAKEHFLKVDDDQFLVFCGHSLGGAASQLAGLELIDMKRKKPENYPDNFCSIFTMGAPAIMGFNLAKTLSTQIPDNWRIYFDNDPVAKITRGKSKEAYKACNTEDDDCIFFQTGKKVKLSGKGTISHRCKEYIDNILSQSSKIKPPCRQFEEGEIHYQFMGGTYFRCLDGELLSYLRTFDLPNFALEKAISHMLYLWSSTKKSDRSFKNCSDPHHPYRGSDMLFYKLWRLEELFKIKTVDEFVNKLKELQLKYNFTNGLYFEYTFLYLKRMIDSLKFIQPDLEELENRTKHLTRADATVKNFLERYFLTIRGEISYPPAYDAGLDALTLISLSPAPSMSDLESILPHYQPPSENDIKSILSFIHAAASFH